MLLTPLYTAPLPAGFQSGTVEIKSPGTYVDQAGRVQQPSYRFAINADGSLTNLQAGGATSVVGMGVGDRLAAPLVDVVIELYVAGSAPLRSTYAMSPADSGSGTLRLQQEKQTAPTVITASVLANLLNKTALYVQGTENLPVGATNLTVETFQAVAPAANAPASAAATNSALAAVGLLAQYQSGTASMPAAPTGQELNDYGVIRGYRTLASGAAQATLYNRSTSTWADDAGAATLSKPLNAIGNTAVSHLGVKGQADGAQFAAGSRWLWSSTGTVDTGTVVASSDAGLWVRELTGPLTAGMFGITPQATGAVNSTRFQAVLDSLHAQGGGTITFGPGVYNFASAVKTYASIDIQGTRKATTFRTVTDNGFIYTDYGQALEGIRISGVIFRREITASVTWHVRLTDTANCKVEDCEFFQYEWTVNADGTPNTTYYTVTAGLWCESTNNGNSFMAQVTRCWFRGAMLNMQQSDSRVTGCYLWGQARQYSLKIDAPNIAVTDCDLIPSTQKGAIWITGNGRWFQIVGGNRIDGSYSTIPTGDGILNEGAYGGVIVGNNFYQCGKSGIHFINVIRCSVGANTYLDNNRINDPAALTPAADTFAYPDVLLDNCQMVRVEGGTHSIATARNRTGGGGGSYAVREINACDNNVISATVQGTYLAAISRAGSNTAVGPSFNANNSRADRSFGSGTIAAGSATSIIPHGLGVMPRRVTLAPTTSLGATKNLWRGGMDATNIVAQVDVAPGSTVGFDWTAEL